MDTDIAYTSTFGLNKYLFYRYDCCFINAQLNLCMRYKHNAEQLHFDHIHTYSKDILIHQHTLGSDISFFYIAAPTNMIVAISTSVALELVTHQDAAKCLCVM